MYGSPAFHMNILLVCRLCVCVCDCVERASVWECVRGYCILVA